MTADEYRAARRTLGMTQRELARAVGVSERTIRMRERGEIVITAQAVKLLRSLPLAPGSGFR